MKLLSRLDCSNPLSRSCGFIPIMAAASSRVISLLITPSFQSYFNTKTKEEATQSLVPNGTGEGWLKLVQCLLPLISLWQQTYFERPCSTFGQDADLSGTDSEDT